MLGIWSERGQAEGICGLGHPNSSYPPKIGREGDDGGNDKVREEGRRIWLIPCKQDSFPKILVQWTDYPCLSEAAALGLLP